MILKNDIHRKNLQQNKSVWYTPFGLMNLIPQVKYLLDDYDGNENYFLLGIGTYFTARGVTGLINLVKQENIEDKLK